MNEKTLNIKSTGFVRVDIDSTQPTTSASTDSHTLADHDESHEPRGKYYIPTLYINDPTIWPSQPMEKRRMFTDEVAQQVCLGGCCGVPGLKAACCHLDMNDLEHVLGPVEDGWVVNTLKWFNKNGIYYKRSDLVIDWEEGKYIGDHFFNSHQVFTSKASYPMLRVQVAGPRLACKFLNEETGRCTIYKHRPPMCEDYFCQYIKTNCLVRTKNKPNTYLKLR